MFRWLRSILNLLFSRPQHNPTNESSTPLIQSLLREHNKERSFIGIKRLALNEELNEIAQQHAEWMSTNQTLSHIGARGSSVGTRAQSVGYPAARIGENIAFGYSTVELVMKGWMNSSGHRRNIQNSGYDECGFGVVDRYWCAVFGTKTRSQSHFNYVDESLSGPLST